MFMMRLATPCMGTIFEQPSIPLYAEQAFVDFTNS